MSHMFYNGFSLASVPALNVSAVTGSNFDNIFAACYSLRRCEITGCDQNISYADCCLSGTALDEIYTNLATATKTITVTGNYGTASDDPSIATAKNWTVTGS
jgi:hypothetical protein